MPLPITTQKDVAPGAAVTPADKARVAAFAAAKAIAALTTMASVQAVDTRAEDFGAASNLLPEPARTVRATGPPQSPGDTELMIVDEAVAVTETSTATYLCEFPENWHEAVPELDFLYWSRVTECDESPHAQAKRYLDWIIEQYDPDHEAGHVYMRENSALVLRLVGLIPRLTVRAHYRALFATAPTLQTDRIVIALFDFARLLVAMYGCKGYDEQITADNRRDKSPIYDPTLGDHWGDLHNYESVLEID